MDARTARERDSLVMVDPALIERVRTGAYVVDPQAVAGAIMRRALEEHCLSRMFVAGEGHGTSGRVSEGGAASGGGPA
jgi:hypothetical protein